MVVLPMDVRSTIYSSVISLMFYSSGHVTAAPPFGYLTSRLAEVPPVWRPLYIGGVGELLMASTGRMGLTCESIRATD